MRTLTVITFIILVCQLIGYTEESSDVAWEEWKQSFNKEYTSDEEEGESRIVWERRVLEIDEFNARNESFKQAVNQFADIREELINVGNGLDTYSEDTEHLYSVYEPDRDSAELPESVDWRDKHVVTPVKSQGGCGSCWAFSATGSLEGQYARKTERLVSFSEQQLVDCSHAYGNNGCDGGLMNNAFRYWMEYDAEKEKSYPYHGWEGTCQYSLSLGYTKVSSYKRISRGECDLLRRAVAEVGPVSVGMDAGQRDFRFYSQGVYRNHKCSSEHLDHGVLVVGYNMKNKPYWIVKNSWGSAWGEGGFFKIEMSNNMCGICSLASYPVI